MMDAPIEDISLEQFKEIIDSGLIEEDIPFDLLVNHYPDLLSEWYPGYPNAPRYTREGDPICCRGHVKDGKVFLNNFTDTENHTISLIELSIPDGEYDLWFHKNSNGEFFVHIMKKGSIKKLSELLNYIESTPNESRKL